MMGITIFNLRTYTLPRAAIVLLACCLLVAAAQALVAPVDDAGRVKDADEIVRGTITDVRSQWNADHTQIATTATVAVTNRMKGQSPDTFTLAVLGGTVDGLTQWVEDEPVLAPGDEAYIFIRTAPPAGVDAHGRAQKVLAVVNGKVQDAKAGKGTGISTAQFDLYLQGLAQGQAVTLPEVTEASPPAATGGPAIASVQPNVGSAGTGTTITITGSGFGTKASRGSNADVAFLYYYDGRSTPWTDYFIPIYATGYPWFDDNANDIVSWTDTKIVARIPIGYTLDSYPGSASSGWVAVLTDSNTVSSFQPFTVTFGYGKAKRTGPAQYYVNPGTLGTGAATAISDAGATWNAALEPNSPFQFTYMGTSTSTVFGLNGENLISFRPASDFPSSNIIAQAQTWFDSSGNIIENDIRFNLLFSWTTGTAGGNTMNVQVICLHELGHWLHLRDLYGCIPGYPSDVGKTMFGICGDFFGNMNDKTLHADDIAGIRYIYPGTTTFSVSSISPTSGTQGATVPVTITGTGFQSGATVKLTKSGSPDIPATSINVPFASTITGQFVLAPNAATGAYNVVVTNPGGVSAPPLSNGFTVNAQQNAVFRFAPPSLGIAKGGTVTTTLYLDGLATGISGFTIDLALANPAIGEIVAVSLPGWALTSSSAVPADSVTIQAVDLSNIVGPGGNALIGTISVRGDNMGTTELRITQYNVDNEAGDDVAAQLAVCTVDVSNVLPIVPGAAYPPKDLNGDGKYEDVNGNNGKDFADIVLYFTQMSWIAANEPLAAFDYNGNQSIDFADIIWLFDNL